MRGMRARGGPAAARSSARGPARERSAAPPRRRRPRRETTILASRGCAAFVLALSLAVASPALAAPSAADRETARALVVEGKQRRDKGDLPGALESFKAADAIMRVPTTG